MQQAQNVINSVERAGTSLYDSIVNSIPLAGNYLTSPEYKIYSQAKKTLLMLSLETKVAQQSVKMNLILLNGSIFLKLVIQTQLFGKNEKTES